MSNKKVLIVTTLSTLTILMLIIGGVLFSVNKQEKRLTENVGIIKSNYAKFTTNVTDNQEIKKELSDLMGDFNNETYKEKHEDYVKILNKYDNNIKYVDSIVKDMESRCKYKYEDAVVTLLCKGYDILYEETINTYITNVNKYNDKLSKYNEATGSKYKSHKLVYEKYIDYDKDGEYEGK